MMYLYLYLPHCGYCGSTDHFQHRYGRDDAEGHYGKGAREEKRWNWHDYAISLLIRRYGYVTVPVFLLSLLAGIVMYAKYTKQLHESAESTSQNIRPQSHPVYDAIIIPGGGLYEDGKPRTFVQARLKKAWTLRHNTKYFILLSRGTTHASG